MSTMNLEQAAAFLHLHPITLSKKAKAGTVPASKPGKRWVFVEVDLIEYLRSQYVQQASEGDNDEVDTCHSIQEKTLQTCGLKSRFQVKSRYNNLLELPTGKKLKSTKLS